MKQKTMIYLEDAVRLLQGCADDFMGYGDDAYALGLRAAAQLLEESDEIEKIHAGRE